MGLTLVCQFTSRRTLQLSVISDQCSVISYQLSVISYQLSVQEPKRLAGVQSGSFGWHPNQNLESKAEALAGTQTAIWSPKRKLWLAPKPEFGLQSFSFGWCPNRNLDSKASALAGAQTGIWTPKLQLWLVTKLEFGNLSPNRRG
jgi:hypothetical protein